MSHAWPALGNTGAQNSAHGVRARPLMISFAFLLLTPTVPADSALATDMDI